MKRPILLIAACVLLGGCQPKARVCLTATQADKLGLNFTDAVATDKHNNVFLIARSNIARYDPPKHQIEYLLRNSRSDLVDLTVAEGDVLLALGKTALHAVFAGELVQVLELPGRGLKASAHGDWVYVLVVTSSGRGGLFRYGFSTKQIEPLLATRGQVSAICAVSGGCLIASRGMLHKLFVPPAGGSGPREVHRVLLLAIAGKEITSIAADPDGKIVYFASPNMTYAWAKKRVVPLFPMGGQLAYADRKLTIASPDLRQVIQLIDPAGRTRQLLGTKPVLLPPTKDSAAGGPSPPRRAGYVKIRDVKVHNNKQALYAVFGLYNGGSSTAADFVVRFSVLDTAKKVLYSRTFNIYDAVHSKETGSARCGVTFADLRARGIAAKSVWGARVSLVRADQAPFIDGIRVDDFDLNWSGSNLHSSFTLENRNDSAVTVRKLHFKVKTSASGTLLSQPTIDVDIRLAPGEKPKVVNVPMLTRKAWDQFVRAGQKPGNIALSGIYAIRL